MSGETTKEKPSAVSVGSTALLGWLGVKLAEAEKALKMREEMAACYRSGTNADWDAASNMHPSTAGMKSTRADRLRQAQNHDRIAVRLRHDRDMFRSTIAALSLQPNESI